MRNWTASLALAVFASASLAFAGSEPASNTAINDEAPSVEYAVESAYLLGVFNSPKSYEVSANFLTARVRWGTNLDSSGFFRGFNQFYVSAEGQSILRGIENHYFGINFGTRYNFVQPDCRLVPYVSGGLGLGWIDSHADIPGGQGQDFTFNILAAAGVEYRINQHWRVNAGVLYEHWSNGGQTDPNPSINLVGPQIGLSCSF